MNDASVETRQQRRRREHRERKAANIRPQKGAFKRALEQFKKVAEVRNANLLLGPVTLQLALMQLFGLIGPYRSRGHGRGGPYPNHNAAAGRSRYMPHQGERECLRRRIGGFAYARRTEQHQLEKIGRHAAMYGTGAAEFIAAAKRY